MSGIKFKKIKLLALDFDGVLTDGAVYIFQDGREVVRCSRKDGLGIELLKKAGILVGIISKETNPVVRARAKKLGVPCWQGVKDGKGKLAILKKLAVIHALSREEIAYMGDDINDLEALEYAGLAITVFDGHAKVKKVADYITRAKGGDHAVREVAECILEAHEK